MFDPRRFLLFFVCFVALVASVAAETAIVRWSFDEANDGAPILDSVTGKSLCSGGESARRTIGLFGGALELQGRVAISVPGNFLPESMEQITVAAWIRPVKIDRYNEIFRGEQGDIRILFSLQENGKFLSLGLNVDGQYFECDAPVEAHVLLDGQWRYAVGTYDGKTAKVYLDGRLIQSVERPGKLHYSRSCRYFIGSSGGHDEFWQGALDELTLTSAAYAPETITDHFRAGLNVIKERQAENEARLAGFYPTESSGFVETLCDLRKNIRDKKSDWNDSLSPLLLGRIHADFPDEFAVFSKHSPFSITEFVRAEDDNELVRKTESLVGMICEFMPLTEDQWSRLSPDELAKWKRIAFLKESFQAKKADSANVVSTLIDLILEADRLVVPRPEGHERVAPYVTPHTPSPRELNADETKTLLEQDWLFQADGKADKNRTLQEIQWTRRLMDRLENDYDSLNFSKERRELYALEESVAKTSGDTDSSDSYFKVRSIKRGVMFRNPLIDFRKILLVDMPYPAGSEWNHETKHRLGYGAVPGAQMLVLDGLSPDAEARRLMPREPLHGAFWRPDLSFDAQKVLFCFKPHNEKAFHVYEINIDGTGLRQITSGMFDDFDPIYLPDGKNFLFTSTRGHTYVRCMPPTNAYVLTRCGLDGDNLYIISGNNEPDYLPSLLHDGRVIYTRWEYTDKPLWRVQSLWTVNPDGTQSNTFWGNQSVWPDLLKDARPIPNSRRVMFTGSAHHDWFAGSVGIVDPDKGLDFPNGLTKVTADVAWPESGNGPVDPIESSLYHSSGKFDAYFSPYPLGERDFIVSARKNGKFSLYLMDVDGNRELIYEGVNNIFHAIPVRPRSVPPMIADRVVWPTEEERFDPKPGHVYSSNVYQGVPEEMVGKAKYLRVLHIEPKTYTYWDHRPYASTGPVVSMVQSEGVKRVLGTVPVREDGSVSFEVPSGIALHFQLLDENHRALQTMRSFVNLMPGESRGCVGCHELEHHSVADAKQASGEAVRGAPSRIVPVPWAFAPDFSVDPKTCESVQQAIESAASKKYDISSEHRRFIERNGTSISFTGDVQPVLEQNCGKCHMGDGEARKVFDMTRRPGFMLFDEPYVTLIGAPNWGGPGIMPTGAWGGGKVHTEKLPPGFGIAGTIPVEAYDQRDPEAYKTFSPMTYLSYRSRLIEIASTGKHPNADVDPEKVKLDPVSLLRLILWVDAMCPYISDEEIRAMPDPSFRGVDWLSIRPRLRTAPTIVRPGPFRADGSDVLPVDLPQRKSGE